MNDQQPHAGYDGYDAYPPGSPTGSFAVDPLFGDMRGGYDHGAGSVEEHGTTQWDTGAHPFPGYGTAYPSTGQWPAQPPQQQQQPHAQAQVYGYPDPAAGQDPSGYSTTGQWDSNAWNATGQFENPGATQQWPAQPSDTGPHDIGTHDIGTYDTGAHDTGTYDTGTYDTGSNSDSGAYRTDPYGTGAYDTGAHDATAWNPSEGAAVPHEAHTPHAPHSTQQFAAVDPAEANEAAAPEPGAGSAGAANGPQDTAEFAQYAGPVEPAEPAEFAERAEFAGAAELSGPGPAPSRSAARRAPGGRGGRRRTPAKRSALLTVAVPSVCVMGVAGVAVASVGGVGGSGKDSATTSQAAADPSSVKPVAANSKLDSQLADLSHEADDFADRASRTQERIDLKERQATAKKKAEEEAARKEAARPKFVLPVTQKGLSAYFGQAGVNWMSVHTGIDFPVSYGTPVMAATDGTVRTQWNSAYGNMAMVTSPDGTETWYCHLSSTKIRSGSVKAGDVIAYSGNSGNSTGPHMHFEVRPHSGAAIDPLPWLRSHGLDPT
ncbi:M23 family metallopeptidase [Streptomyces sp. NBC_00859]|uniref:M23 family metallopeptidase n=1 Tax=Streptomyces sp. NBC_00859 TaxID=2903682 RepID=UPI00386F9A84|nr:M23 family metallopeptidase [Streptomyces sp. NBC_00859]